MTQMTGTGPTKKNNGPGENGGFSAGEWTFFCGKFSGGKNRGRKMKQHYSGGKAPSNGLKKPSI
jgi:hypothetical protein